MKIWLLEGKTGQLHYMMSDYFSLHTTKEDAEYILSLNKILIPGFCGTISERQVDEPIHQRTKLALTEKGIEPIETMKHLWS